MFEDLLLILFQGRDCAFAGLDDDSFDSLILEDEPTPRSSQPDLPAYRKGGTEISVYVLSILFIFNRRQTTHQAQHTTGERREGGGR